MGNPESSLLVYVGYIMNILRSTVCMYSNNNQHSIQQIPERKKRETERGGGIHQALQDQTTA